MTSERNANARAQAAYRKRQREAGLVKLDVWVPAELAEQARKVVAELVERHKGRQ